MFPELSLELLEAFRVELIHPFPSRLVFGMLYPAYYSYKAVKTKNVKEYVSRFPWFSFSMAAVHKPWRTAAILESWMDVWDQKVIGVVMKIIMFKANFGNSWH